MIRVEISENLYALAETLSEYQRTTGKTASEVIARNMPKLTFFLRKFYGELRKNKGAIRAEIIARLAVGLGVNVRPSSRAWAINKLGGRPSMKVSGSRLNVQALAVKREIGTRSSGGGFLAWSWAMKRIREVDLGYWSGDTSITQPHYSKFGQYLGKAVLRQRGQDSTLTLSNAAENFSAALNRKTYSIAGKDPGLSIAARALDAVRRDVQVYLERKAAERLSKMLESASRAIPRLVA